MAADRRHLTTLERQRRDWVIDTIHLTVVRRLRRRRRARRLASIRGWLR